jgi:hypothetical protein
MARHEEVLTWSPERMRQESDLFPNNTMASSIGRDTFLETLTDGFFEPVRPTSAAYPALDPVIIRDEVNGCRIVCSITSCRGC